MEMTILSVSKKNTVAELFAIEKAVANNTKEITNLRNAGIALAAAEIGTAVLAAVGFKMASKTKKLSESTESSVEETTEEGGEEDV